LQPFPIERTEWDETGWTVTLSVPATCPAFRGHFPDRPVLPAIAQYRLLEDVVSHCLDRAVVLRRLPSLRLKQTIEPEDRIQVRIDRDRTDDTSFRFVLGIDSTRVTSGVAEFEPR